MALTLDAGGSAHHVILLWPFPVLFAAIALSRLAELGAGKWLASAIAFGLIAMNLVVLNQYVVQFERDGPAETFTDAIYPLSDNLSAYATRPIYIVDWGVLNVLEFLHQGHLNLLAANEPLMTDAPPEAQVKMLHAMLANPSGVFVSHITPEEMFPLVNERLDRFAAASGYKKELLATIPDSNGRPRFEIFHFR